MVRHLKNGEETVYRDIINSSISNLSDRYSARIIEGWMIPTDDQTLQNLRGNAEREVRLIAELGGELAGVGALILEPSELRACYVRPESVHRGCGSALVCEIERLVQEHGLHELTLTATQNAVPFYLAREYLCHATTHLTLRNGCASKIGGMRKRL